MDNKEIFTKIYDEKIWGGKRKGYYSGSGSHMKAIIKPYISYLNNFLELNDIKSIVDIGCGDFNIMKCVLKKRRNIRYYGIDVVEGLIQYNNEKYGNENTTFICKDATDLSQEIPNSDLVICRQVLQHLDNNSVEKILSRFKGHYKYALITEGIRMSDGYTINSDKPTNNETRTSINSGIWLEKEPFNQKNIVTVVSYAGADDVYIRTSLICM